MSKMRILNRRQRAMRAGRLVEELPDDTEDAAETERTLDGRCGLDCGCRDDDTAEEGE